MKKILLFVLLGVLAFNSFGTLTPERYVASISVERYNSEIPILKVKLVGDSNEYAFGADPNSSGEMMITASWISLLQKAVETNNPVIIDYNSADKIIKKIKLCN